MPSLAHIAKYEGLKQKQTKNASLYRDISKDSDSLPTGWRLGAADERAILKATASSEAVLVTNENFRETAQESEEFRKVIEERTLIFSYINNHFVPPDDPIGRLEQTLRLKLRRKNMRIRKGKKLF